ncbi:MAG: hypothetical protein ACRC17_05685 [Culicoidibacterales bacterium]
MKKVAILGASYKIKKLTQKQKQKHKVNPNAIGLCCFFEKEILVADGCPDLKKETVRHEVIHAFLSESGLRDSSTNAWAVNEEMVDWFAIQWHKIHEVIIKGEEAIE